MLQRDSLLGGSLEEVHSKVICGGMLGICGGIFGECGGILRILGTLGDVGGYWGYWGYWTPPPYTVVCNLGGRGDIAKRFAVGWLPGKHYYTDLLLNVPQECIYKEIYCQMAPQKAFIKRFAVRCLPGKSPFQRDLVLGCFPAHF